MPLLIIDAGELTGCLREGAEARVLASMPSGHAGGARIVVDAVHVFYRIEVGAPAPGVIPNIDPYRGYEGDAPLPNGENAHPYDDATGHVVRTHDDFGSGVEKKHITELPSWGGVGC
jgi:hypothetical protein